MQIAALKEKHINENRVSLTPDSIKIFQRLNLDVLIDKSLSRFAFIFAAAGHPNCIFKVNYTQLVKITNGSEREISE